MKRGGGKGVVGVVLPFYCNPTTLSYLNIQSVYLTFIISSFTSFSLLPSYLLPSYSIYPPYLHFTFPLPLFPFISSYLHIPSIHLLLFPSPSIYPPSLPLTSSSLHLLLPLPLIRPPSLPLTSCSLHLLFPSHSVNPPYLYLTFLLPPFYSPFL